MQVSRAITHAHSITHVQRRDNDADNIRDNDAHNNIRPNDADINISDEELRTLTISVSTTPTFVSVTLKTTTPITACSADDYA